MYNDLMVGKLHHQSDIVTIMTHKSPIFLFNTEADNKTRCCTLHHAKNTPTRSFVSNLYISQHSLPENGSQTNLKHRALVFITANMKNSKSHGIPGKGKHGTSHHAKAIYQI